MFVCGRKLFKSCALYDSSVSPSLWTLSIVAPIHTKESFEQLGLGLGANTMEGREQKHQTIKRYIENATYQNRWEFIYRHEYMQLIFLRENGFDKISYRKRGTQHIPDCQNGFCSCSLKLLANHCCQLYNSREMKAITEEMKNY